MTLRLWLPIALLGLSLAACKKPPAFQPLLEGFVAEVAQSHHAQASGYLADQAQLADTMTGELKEGAVEHFPMNRIGRYAWSKVTVQRDEKASDGSHDVTLLAEVCMAADENAACMRPDTYTWRMKVVPSADTWLISAAAITPKNLVR